MAALVFTLKAQPPERLDLSPLVPARLAGLSHGEIAAIPIGTTRKGATVGDLFAIAGDDAADIRFEGGSDRFDRVGASLSEGRITVEGDVGAYAGRGMKGGTLAISGSLTGPHGAAGMTGGRITVRGHAAAATAGAEPGAMQGMAGGLLEIGGDAGAYLGDRMRRGVIVVHGRTGEAAAARMIGGTIIAGAFGPRAGTGLRRGTLIARKAEAIEPTFVPAGDYDGAFLSLLARWLVGEGIDGALVPARGERYRGDMAALGKGELILG